MEENLLKIDAKKTAAIIENYIRTLVKEKNANGALIGLSGGIDSAVLTKLAVNAVGKGSVRVVHLPDRDSEKSSLKRAVLLSESLGLELEVFSIKEEMKKQKIYAPMIMKMNIFSRTVNKLFVTIYKFFFKETGFVCTLNHGKCAGRGTKQKLYDMTIKPIETAFNARHIYRRKFLEEKADKENLILFGSANRSEAMVGWFVKNGVDDLYYSPLAGLYKTQILELADYLKLPSVIRRQIPSPDMMRGITDEFAIGTCYKKIDLILDGLDQNLTEEKIMRRGARGKEIKNVKKIHLLSAWKRTTKHDPPPADGSYKGNVRI